MDDETPTTRPPTPAAEPTTSDAELSRIAREAVRQPADPRMDRQLARMGLTDGADDDARRASPAAGPSALSTANAARIEQLASRVRWLQVLVVVLLIAVVALAVALVARTAS
jgi:hypothetical protein